MWRRAGLSRDRPLRTFITDFYLAGSRMTALVISANFLIIECQACDVLSFGFLLFPVFFPEICPKKRARGKMK